MNDAGSGRDDEHVGEGIGTPLQEGEPLDVPLVLKSLVLLQGVWTA